MTTMKNVDPLVLAEDLLQYMQEVEVLSASEARKIGAELGNDHDLGKFLSHITQARCLQATIAQPNAPDVEGSFNVLGTLIGHIPSGSLRSGFVQNFMDAVVTTQNVDSLLQLRVLAGIYNITEEFSKDRLNIFQTMIRFASLTGNVRAIEAYLEQVEGWVKQWNLTVSETKDLYILIADVLEKDGKAGKAQSFILNALSLYDNCEDVGELSTVRDIASRAAIGALRTPIVSFTQQDNVTSMVAVKQLEGDKKYGTLYKLLHIFALEKLDSYLAFYKTYQSYLEELGLDHDLCQTNMRLLSLCSLASEHSEIPYALIAETLQIDASQVEEWVVLAITEKLIDGRMDQPRSVVSVNRCTHRVFGQDQWNNMANQLNAYADNLNVLLQNIKHISASN